MNARASASDAFPHVPDGKAIRDVLAGNREMFEVLVRRHNQRLYRVGMAYLHDHARTEDAMQNTYLKAFLHLRQFGKRASAGTWLTRIMINECLMTLRRLRHDRDSQAAEAPVSGVEPVAETNLTMKEMKTLLEQSIASLRPRLRRVFVLREIEQLSTAETAACLSLSPANVRVSLHRAHEHLKAELLRHAASAELFAYPAEFCDPLTARVMESVLALE